MAFKKNKTAGGQGESERLTGAPKQADLPIYVFFILLTIYLLTTILVPMVSRSEYILHIGELEFPVSTFAGVLTSIGNTCIIFLVVFFKRMGFYTSLALLVVQIPLLLRTCFVMHNFLSLPGLFLDILTIIAIVLIYQRNRQIKRFRDVEMRHFAERQKASQRLFEQTVTALVNAVDAKDTYSHGHSLRVAEYSEMIAKRLKKDEDECRRIYYAALLHDVGKIGIPNHIINKKGKLTEEEFDIIKQHPVKGNAILSSISEYPYLSIGAHFHHERYDGGGYPDGIKGEDIPEIARIISVADAYDAMSSNRSYRDVIPQQLIREELVKGAGTQFDPRFAEVMLELIDKDPDYRMQEKPVADELAGRNSLKCGEDRSDMSDGIQVDQNTVSISMKVKRNDEFFGKGHGPALILFDSLDSRVHSNDETRVDLCYYEYAEIWLEGEALNKGVRKLSTKVVRESSDDARKGRSYVAYEIKAVKCLDHVLVTVDDGCTAREYTFALPDSSRYAYLCITGEQCEIFDVSINRAEEPVSVDSIERIADEISYIDGPVGDIPNLQVNNHRTAYSEGIPLTDRLVLKYHTMSLPTARLVWHCPYFVIYTSKDGKVNGEGYKEYALIRLDGESRNIDGSAKNKYITGKLDAFEGWEAWKEGNKKGFDSEAVFNKKSNVVYMKTENLGLSIRNNTSILDENDEVYVAITGDQCAVTNIRISR